MIELQHVSKEYRSQNGIITKAVDDVNLKLDRGLVAIVGKSGSGKTTLLNLIGGIDTITSGKVIYNQVDLSAFKARDYDYYRQKIISYIFQDYNLLNDCSVIDNIKIACRLQGSDNKQVNIKANEALKAVNLSDYADRKITSLSGGQQQRVAIARAIAKDSQIVLSDEPTGNLDSKNAAEIFELLKSIAKQRLVVVVTHDEESAKNYADRVIRLFDGRIIEDNANRVNISLKAQQEPQAIYGRKNCGLSGRDTILLIGKNFKSALFANLIVAVLLVAAITLSTLFLSLYQYNSQDALTNTLKSNHENVIQITKYKDYPRLYTDENNNTKTMHGPELWCEDTQIEDLLNLRTLTEYKANFYTSYFFNKNFQDFTSQSIYTDLTAFQFEVNSFRSIIAVDDFATFYLPLQYGRTPNAKNEILIYDYIGHCLIYHNVFDCDISDLIGKTLTDWQTGTSMIISGIIGSHYEQYSYIKNDNAKHEFEETYLSSLQAIYCNSEFIEEIKPQEKNYSSIYNCYFSSDDNDIFYAADIKKMMVTDITKYKYIATIDNYENERGIIVDKAMVAKILDIRVDEVTAEKARKVLDNVYVNGLKSYLDYTIERNLLTTYAYRIIAVAEEVPENVLNFYTPAAEDLYMYNMAIRQFYLSLGNDWTLNKEILDKFIYQTHDDAFYIAHPDYSYEGYTDYTSYGILIRDADFYLIKVRDFSKNIMIILICVSAVGMYFYALFQIRKNHYKIGILKSMGASNSNIMLLFGLQILVVGLLSYLISVPISYGMMSSINATFIHGVNPKLIFFSITPFSILLMFIFSLCTISIATVIPLLRLYFQSPLSIIRQNT